MVAKAAQHLGYVPITRRILLQRLKFNRERLGQKRRYLIQRADLRFAHVDHHLIDDRPEGNPRKGR